MLKIEARIFPKQTIMKKSFSFYLFALVGSLSSVHTAMLLHCTARRERFLAEVARVGTLACVRAHVYLQQAGSVELLVAELAVVLLLALDLTSVRAQVLTQVILAAEHATAHLARVRWLWLAVAACLDYVPLQMVLAAEHFIAPVASVRLQT